MSNDQVLIHKPEILVDSVVTGSDKNQLLQKTEDVGLCYQYNKTV